MNVNRHAPDQPFDSGRCPGEAKPSGTETSTNRVQVLLPATLPKLWSHGMGSPLALAPHGALLFGHSLRFPLRWRDKGDPEIGKTEDSLVEDVEMTFTDSALGSSLATSSEDAVPGNSLESPAICDASANISTAPANISTAPSNVSQPPLFSEDRPDSEEGPSSKRRKLFGKFMKFGE